MNFEAIQNSAESVAADMLVADDKLNKLETRAALAGQDTAVELVYVAEVNAIYIWDPASVVPSDGWGVIAATGGGTGRWVLFSDGLTVRPSGSNDRDNLFAAGNAVAALGKKLYCPAGEYLLNSIWNWPLAPLHLVATQSTVFTSGLTPNGQPGTAPFYCSAGAPALVRTTTVAAANQVGRYTITVANVTGVQVGHYLRVRDDVSGAQVIGGVSVVGFTGATFQVRAISGTGPFTVTVDRPVLFQLQSGDEALFLSDVPKGHVIEGFPTIRGSGVRLIEFIGVLFCRIQANLIADNVTDVAGSFDLFGYKNLFEGQITRKTGTVKDGWLLESNEASECRATVKGFVNGTGVSIFHGLRCRDASDASGNLIGIGIRGYGVHGSRDCEVLGQYDSNTNQGIGVVNGSIGTIIRAAARFNPINLAISGAERTFFEGNFRSGSSNGVAIAATAIGTSAGVFDTGDSATGLNTQANLTFDLHQHHGSIDATGRVLLNDGAIVRGQVDYDVSTNGVNVVVTAGASLTTLIAGTMAAGAGSNLVFGSGTSTVQIGAVTGTAPGGRMCFMNANTRAVISLETIYTATGGLGGAGIYAIPERPLYQGVGASSTAANTTETTLKAYTVPLNTLQIGSRLSIEAYGVVANTSGAKTLRLKIGSATLITFNAPTGAGEAWRITADIDVTTLTSEQVLVQAMSGALSRMAQPNLSLDVTTSLAVAVTGQNGSAVAGEIVCQGLRVVRRAI